MPTSAPRNQFSRRRRSKCRLKQSLKTHPPALEDKKGSPLPGSVALGVHVGVVLGDLGARPVGHRPRPGRVLRVPPAAPGHARLAVELGAPGAKVDRRLRHGSGRNRNFQFNSILYFI